MQSVDTFSRNTKVVVIGGGSGSANLLRGLKHFTENLTAIVTMFDTGGSSGLLRREFGYPPFGDLRQCVLALGNDVPETKALRDAFDFRFGLDTSLNGHSVGNLLFAALTSLNDDLEQAIEQLSLTLQITGQVVPVTLGYAELCAELDDGNIIQGESDIDLRATPLPRIKRIFLAPQVEANPRAIQAIVDADAIVLGPGDLYTSILPNLLAEGMSEAIASSSAATIYVCNLMTKRGETDDFAASDFVREINSYIQPTTLDWAIINSDPPESSIQDAYKAEGAHPVTPDLDTVAGMVKGVIAGSLGTEALPIRHDSKRAAEAVLKAVKSGKFSLGRARVESTLHTRP